MIYGIQSTECEEPTDEQLQARLGDLCPTFKNDRSKWPCDVQEAYGLLNEAKRRRKCSPGCTCSKCCKKEPEGRSLLRMYPPA